MSADAGDVFRVPTIDDPVPVRSGKSMRCEELTPGKQLPKGWYIEWNEERSTDPGCKPWHWLAAGKEMDSRQYRCDARKKNSVERCAALRMKGAHVCRNHGGGRKQVKQAIERRRSEAELVQTMSELRKEMRMGEGPVEDRDPTLVLGDMLGLVRGDILAIRQALVTVDLNEDIATPKASMLIDTYGKMIDRAARMAESLVKVKQADRSLSMAESTQAMERLQRVAELGKNPEYRDAAVKVAGMMRQRLLALDEQTDDFAAGSALVVEGE